MDRNVGIAVGAALVAMIGIGATAETLNAPVKASTTLSDANGATKGDARLSKKGHGIRVDAEVSGMAPGTYAIHVHQVGSCVAPGFTSAGPHWNPTGKQHGHDNPAGSHKGDLPNITVGAKGTGRVTFEIKDESLADLLDADGAALVVHAKPDDYKTDPSGASGDRIACGVLKAG